MTTRQNVIIPLLAAISLAFLRFLLRRWTPGGLSYEIASFILDLALCLLVLFLFLRLRPSLAEKTPVSFLTCLGVMLISAGLARSGIELFHQTGAHDLSGSWFRIADLLLLSPVIEEFVYRGLGYGRMRHVLPKWSAALLSALLFAAGHLDTGMMVPALLFGLLAALLFELSGSILWPIVLHILVNAFHLFPSPDRLILMGIIAAGCVMLFISSSLYIRKSNSSSR